MNKQNSFSISFGLQPDNYIERVVEQRQVVEDFEMPISPSMVYVLNGVRGCGKTVLLSSIADHFKDSDDWFVVDASSKHNILELIVASIYEQAKVKRLFVEKSLNFSFHGVSINLKGSNPISHIEILIAKVLEELKKQNKRVLVTIDEADNSEEMRYFISCYQTLIRDKYPVYLLMTGLYENIDKLQNDKALTFLARAPKINLGPLSLATIAARYKQYLGVDEQTSIEMAKLTNGYAYAYQVLGFLFYKNNFKTLNDNLIIEFDQYLKSYVYDFIYRRLSNNEQLILKAFDNGKQEKYSEISKKANISERSLSVYRVGLIRKGLIESPTHGYLRLTLPRFAAYLSLED